MSGSKTNAMNRKQVIEAVRAQRPDRDFVWDGKTRDDRPATRNELAAAALKRGRGRPAGSGIKEQVAIRLDRDVLAAFRATGAGWQTRLNEVLKRAVKRGSI